MVVEVPKASDAIQVKYDNYTMPDYTSGVKEVDNVEIIEPPLIRKLIPCDELHSPVHGRSCEVWFTWLRGDCTLWPKVTIDLPAVNH